MPPKTILNAPTTLMRQIGYGAGYAYDHDEPDAFSGQDYWPDALGRQTFYDADRARLRARGAEAAGMVGEAAARAARGRVITRPPLHERNTALRG